MTSIITLAGILLLARIGSQLFIITVIRKQYALSKLPIYPEIKHFRNVLFILSLVLFVGNFIPITIDLATLFTETGRPAQLGAVSVLYTVSVAIVSLLSAYLIHKLYKLADTTKQVNDDIINAKDKRMKGMK